MTSNAPWWWFEGGTEICSMCGQPYAYQTGSYCRDCDCKLCPMCLQEAEGHEALCSACCEQG